MRSLARISIVTVVLLFGGMTISAQTATFSGRITEQTNGQGISGAVVVAEGNVTGTRVVVTDAQGNYNLTIGANTNIRLRAYKPTYTFNPVLVGFVSTGPAISGSFSQDFAGTSFPILIIAFAPVLLTEDSSLNALTLDGLVRTRDPFTVNNDHYFGSDQRARLTLLLVDLDLHPNQGETLANTVTVQAQDSQSRTFSLPPEDLRKVPDFPWMSQLTVRVPSDLAGSAEATVTVTARNQASKGAKVRFQ